jgi:hypothetical protein
MLLIDSPIFFEISLKKFKYAYDIVALEYVKQTLLKDNPNSNKQSQKGSGQIIDAEIIDDSGN